MSHVTHTHTCVTHTHTHTADSSHGPKPIDNAEKLSFWLASVLPGT